MFPEASSLREPLPILDDVCIRFRQCEGKSPVTPLNHGIQTWTFAKDFRGQRLRVVYLGDAACTIKHFRFVVAKWPQERMVWVARAWNNTVKQEVQRLSQQIQFIPHRLIEAPLLHHCSQPLHVCVDSCSPQKEDSFIYATDPLVLLMGFRVGERLKITTAHRNAGQTVLYRVVRADKHKSDK